MTIEEHQATDDGMPEPPQRTMPDTLTPSTWLPSGTRIRATRGAEGIVLGFDPDLRMPLVEWQTDYTTECVDLGEYEIVR